MTITEALAEIKTIGKRIISKQQSLTKYIGRSEQVKDPLEKEGGSAEFIKRERQAIKDLQERIIAIRTSIQHANMNTLLTIGKQTRSIFEWLSWRREVSAIAKHQADEIWAVVQNLRQQATTSGRKIVAAAVALQENAQPTDIIVNVSETELAAEREEIETTLGALDGQLSLLNATTQIAIRTSSSKKE